MRDKIEQQKAEAYEKAIDSLARYKFLMFGYHAAQWVMLNQLSKDFDPNPFHVLVKEARGIQAASHALDDLERQVTNEV